MCQRSLLKFLNKTAACPYTKLMRLLAIAIPRESKRVDTCSVTPSPVLCVAKTTRHDNNGIVTLSMKCMDLHCSAALWFAEKISTPSGIFNMAPYSREKSMPKLACLQPSEKITKVVMDDESPVLNLVVHFQVGVSSWPPAPLVFGLVHFIFILLSLSARFTLI